MRLRQDVFSTMVFDGKDMMLHFQGELLTTAQLHKTDICINAIDERKFLKASKYMPEHFVRLNRLGVRERALLPEGDRFFISTPDVTTYRWLPHEFAGFVPHFIYGDKVAFVFWSAPSRILVIENPSMARTFRRHFEALWKLSQAVPFTAREIRAMVAENLGI